MKRGLRVAKSIPTMVLVVASIDDVYVIIVYSALIAIHTGTSANIIWQLTSLPISLFLGAARFTAGGDRNRFGDSKKERAHSSRDLCQTGKNFGFHRDSIVHHG